MDCPYCQAKSMTKLSVKTTLGYAQYRCCDCGKQFNERTGTPYNYLQYPTDVVVMAVYLYYRFKNSLDDVVELMAMRGIHVSHQTIYNWVHRFGVEVAKRCRESRHGQAGPKWHMDVTYLRIEGRWCYLYRAMDKEGDLVDVYLSDTRNQATAEDFFLQAEHTTGVTPDLITTDKEPALAAAIDGVFGNGTRHRTSKYLNNCMEANHCGTKGRLKVMRGFKDIFSALRFCTVFEEVRQFFRLDSRRGQECGVIASRIQRFFKVAEAITWRGFLGLGLRY